MYNYLPLILSCCSLIQSCVVISCCTCVRVCVLTYFINRSRPLLGVLVLYSFSLVIEMCVYPLTNEEPSCYNMWFRVTVLEFDLLINLVLCERNHVIYSV